MFSFTTNITSDVEYILVDLTSDKTAFEYALGRASNNSYGVYLSEDKILLFQHEYYGSPVIFSPLSEVYDFQSLNIGDSELLIDSTANSSTVIIHRAKNPISNLLWSGPYTALPPGNYTVLFKMKIDKIIDGELLTLDVAAESGNLVLTRKRLLIREFEENLKWQNISISFELDKTYTDVEFRGLEHSNLTQIYLDQIYLTQNK